MVYSYASYEVNAVIAKQYNWDAEFEFEPVKCWPYNQGISWTRPDLDETDATEF